jgi:hypothetical protein
VIIDGTLRLQVFGEGVDSVRGVFGAAKDVGCGMVWLGGVEDDMGLLGYGFSWLVRFGEGLDRVWECLEGLRRGMPGPSGVTQRGFAEFMERGGSGFQNIWVRDGALYERVTKNVEYLRSHLDRFEAAVRVCNFNSTVWLSLILDLEKLGFEDDGDFCQEFLAQKKYKCLPLKKTCGGASSGIRVCLTQNREVYEGFSAALQDFINQREVAR